MNCVRLSAIESSCTITIIDESLPQGRFVNIRFEGMEYTPRVAEVRIRREAAVALVKMLQFALTP